MIRANPTQPQGTTFLEGLTAGESEGIVAALHKHGVQMVGVQGAIAIPSLIYDVSWDEYDALMTALPERRLPHTYDRGTLEIMSPSKPHEWIKKLIGRMVESMTLELNIPIQSVGSTTLRRELLKRGLEPDDSYYIANEARVRGKETLDLQSDPPPDLVIEVDVTSSCLDRLDVYAALRVARKGAVGRFQC
jgi:Uma2 family endonuclease